MTRTEMTAEAFSEITMPHFSSATDKNTIAMLEIIIDAARQCKRRDLSAIAAQVLQLISNYRMHPAAAAELISTIARSVYEALAEYESK